VKPFGFSVFIAMIASMLGCSTPSSQKGDSIHLYGLTDDQCHYVITETAAGGKLDFERNFKDQSAYVVDGTAYNRKDAALFLWGQAMNRIGIQSDEDAMSLYEEIKSIHLTEPQIQALKNGFNRKR
jgi:hypothetical protein